MQTCICHAFVQTAASAGNALFLIHLSKTLAPVKAWMSHYYCGLGIPSSLVKHCLPKQTQLPEDSQVILSYSPMPHYLNAIPIWLNINGGNE